MRSQVGCHTAVSALPNLLEYREEGEGQGSDQGDNEESGRLSYCCLCSARPTGVQ